MSETKRIRFLKFGFSIATGTALFLQTDIASAQLNWFAPRKEPQKTDAKADPRATQNPKREPTLAPPRDLNPQPQSQPTQSYADPAQPTDAGGTDSALPPPNTSPSLVLLKDASEKVKTAKNDGDLSEVIALAEEAIKEKPSPEAKAYAERLLSWSLNRRGQMFSENQLHDQAIADFTAALKYDPSLWRALHNRGVSYASLGKSNEALADFNRTLELNRNFANTWYNRAELLFENKMYDKAYGDFSQVLRLNPNDAGAYAGRGKSGIRLGKIREAAADLDQAVKLEPRDASLRVVRAELYQYGRNFSIATSDFQEAIKLNPQAGSAYRGLAWIMATCPDEKFRNAESGVKMAQKAMEIDGDSDPRYIETLAAAYANAGQYDAGSELLKHGMQKANGEVAARMQLQLTAYKESKPWRDGEMSNSNAVQVQQQRQQLQPPPRNQQNILQPQTTRAPYPKQATRPQGSNR